MRHFRLSLFGHVVSLMVITAIALLGVCFELHKSVVQETLYSMLAIWAVFTIYFWAMLYGGIRFDRGLVEGWRREYISMEDAKEFRDGLLQSSDIPVCIPDSEGCVALAFGLVLFCLIAVFAPFLIWFGVNAAIISFLAVFLALYWIFRRGLRLVMVNVKRCKGDYLKSLYVSALHSLGYAMLFGVFVYATESAVPFLQRSTWWR